MIHTTLMFLDEKKSAIYSKGPLVCTYMESMNLIHPEDVYQYLRLGYIGHWSNNDVIIV